ncbi:3-isopropylmalate dehydrogenase [Psychromarinibacter halotolerans]|uniref:3-isopropylmalate dehydrogenase n=1 Tax=Psychromarinibacter halotolerans TaxID=1775175 RepID=A0ABV7GW54_9RHOB|nr:3-isopropylmalate dehydrogenase [Psychromarinibacter halotolerans]MDF0597638.1 3-isopropylmalate dehydrogenase [Psychromarinibacter halotolerans]
MTSYNLLLLPGDGIGPEIMAEAAKVLAALSDLGLAHFETEEDLVGGAAIDARGNPLSDETIALAKAADATLFGAVGGPKWDGKGPFHLRPEIGILGLRKALGLYANLRPAKCYGPLATASSLHAELVSGLDILVVRELTGGVYFGQPKEIVTLQDGQRRAVDTQVYTTSEVERIGRVAFDLARKRKNLVHSADKNNVMRTGTLWRETITDLHAAEFADVTLEHILADNLGMQLVRKPGQFDVLVMDNLFGDLLSDVAAMLTGSLGMLPSASLGDADPVTGSRPSLYEPIHGSAPDIAGQGFANPLAMIGSLAMSLRYSLDEPDLADRVEAAIESVLEQGLRTPDIAAPGQNAVSTAEMGTAVAEALRAGATSEAVA